MWENDGKYLNWQRGLAWRAVTRRGGARRGGEGGGRSPVPELPLLPHKYGFSRAVYERKRVEAREAGRA